MKRRIIFCMLFLGFLSFALFAEDAKDADKDNLQIYNLLVLGKFNQVRKESDDPKLKEAIDALFSLNAKVAQTYEKYIGENITLDVGGLPLSGTLVKIKDSKLFMKLKREKGSVVLPIKVNTIPLDKRLQKVTLPELSTNLCLGAKFFRQKNYQAADIFFSKTGSYADGLKAAMLKKSKYFFPLYKACREGDIAAIDALIKQGGDINNSCSAMVLNSKTKKHKLKSSTLLMETIKCRQPKIAEYLVEQGADVNKENSDGVTPLMLSIMLSDDTELLKFLIKHKAKIEHIDLVGNTPLSGAVALGRKAAVKVLLNNGADPNVATQKGYTPLIIAMMSSRVDIMQILLDAGANPDDANPKGYTPLMISVSSNRADILQMLLDAGADINKKHPEGLTIFQLDQRGIDPRILKMLNDLAPDEVEEMK